MKSEIKSFIVDNFLFGQNDNSLTEETSFIESGIIDSTGILEIVAFIEQRFGVSVADEDLMPENFDSINNLCSYITRTKGGSQPFGS